LGAMNWFNQAFGKCLKDATYVLPEGEGAPKTVCICGKTKISWAYDKAAHRAKCFCNDCQQRVAWVDGRGGRKFSGGPVVVSFVWNDILDFQNVDNTKWYRLRKADWTKHGPMDFCVAECCSSIMCGTHPWYDGKFVWTITERSPVLLKSMKPYWAQLFTGDALQSYFQSNYPKQVPPIYEFTGAKDEVAPTKAKFLEFGKLAPQLRGKTIEEYKWPEKRIEVLGLTADTIQCGVIAPDKKKADKQEQNNEQGWDPLKAFACCSRKAGATQKVV